MATVNVNAPNSNGAQKVWRFSLTVLGAVAVVAGAAVEVVAVNYHQVTQASVTGATPDLTTTTVTGPSGPATGLITGLLGAGVILLVLAAFLPRITKVIFPWGGELDFATNAALTGVIATKTSDANEAERLYVRAAPRAAEAIAATATPTRLGARLPAMWNTQSMIDDSTLNQIVDSVR
jgi:hypothetical protein